MGAPPLEAAWLLHRVSPLRAVRTVTLSQYAREYRSRVREHGQEVADRSPAGTGSALAGGVPSSPARGPEVETRSLPSGPLSRCVLCEAIFPGMASVCRDCEHDDDHE